jgi:hypothetical protein
MRRLARLVLGACLFATTAGAQTLELFGGHERATEDVMFFKFFLRPKPPTGEAMRSDVLFFFRARVGADYAMTETSSLPQFGLTSALSYNPKAWRGFAPVAVVQVFNQGVFPKAGVQFVHSSARTTVFSWIVCETLARPTIDLFALARHVKPLDGAVGLFVQGESVNALPTDAARSFSFTIRARVGLQWHRWQFGPGVDVTSAGRKTFTRTTNVGGFARYEF